MCGFIGEVAFKSFSISDKESFLDLNRIGAERGPDSNGYFSDNARFQFGFNRLSVLDLSDNANQPMCSKSDQYVIVFNGEIYNHLEIRASLSHQNFQGNSDTETLSAALDEWGVMKTVQSLDGMFALGIYSLSDKKLYLARDFAGVKPLFYGINNEKIVFASQYDQVASHTAFKKQPIDPQVLNLYLQQHFLPAPFGLLQKTYQLNPGEMLVINSEGNVHKEQYWSFPEVSEPSIFEKREAEEFIAAELEKAVKAEMLSDVPLGTFLSGGIDSPLITYFAKQHLVQQLKSFTIGSDSSVHDESEAAMKYGELIGVDHHIDKMDSGSARAIMDDVMKVMHEPLADFSIIPTFLVAQLARKKVKVILSGDGGDELFFGYERFWSVAKNRQLYSLPYPLKYLAYGIDKVVWKNKHINSAILSSKPGIVHQQLHSRFSSGLLGKVSPESYHAGLPQDYKTFSYNSSTSFNELLGQMRRAEFYGMMQKTLRKVDLASMGNSLEVRVPFLKKSFIEAAAKIDPVLSAGENSKKQLLKDILRNKLPQSPIDDVKKGFSIPLSKWIREQLKETFEDSILQEHVLNNFGFSKPAVEKMMKDHLEKKIDHKWPIFTIFALAKWKDNLKN